MLFIQYMYSLKRSNRPDLAKFMFCMCHSVYSPMLNMAIPVPDLDMMSTEPSKALGSSMCSLFQYIFRDKNNIYNFPSSSEIRIQIHQ